MSNTDAVLKQTAIEQSKEGGFSQRRALPFHLIAILAAFATLGIAAIAMAAPAAASGTDLAAAPANTAPDAGPTTSVDIHMDARLGGLKFGSISMQAAFADTSYTANSTIRTEGITDHIFKTVFDLKTRGTRGGALMQTAAYHSYSTSEDDRQKVDMTYGPEGLPLVAAEPAYDNSSRVAATAYHLKNSVDPLSAVIVPLAEPSAEACNRRIPVYDGRRRYDFVMSFDRMSPLDEEKGYSGPAVRCNAYLRPIAGYKRKTIREMRKDPMPITVWLAPVEGADALVPARIEVGTPIGTLVARSTRFTVSQANPDHASLTARQAPIATSGAL